MSDLRRVLDHLDNASSNIESAMGWAARSDEYALWCDLKRMMDYLTSQQNTVEQMIKEQRKMQEAQP